MLYGDYRATPAKAVLAVHSSSSMRRPLKGEVLWHREYRKEVDIMEQTPEALVSGWNEALRLILSALDEDLTEHSGVSDAWADKAVTGVIGTILPTIQEGQPTDWRQVIDTSLPSPEDFRSSGRRTNRSSLHYRVTAWSIEVLLRKAV